jgi:predicted GTPase
MTTSQGSDSSPTPGGAAAGASGAADVGTATARMVTALVRLRQALTDVVLPLDLVGADEQRRSQAELVAQLEDYVIPRMTTIEAPVLAVVGGSTGAGKSTLVNSLVGSRVTTPGLLRPTTRSPVLVHNPADAQWFGQDRLLPELERVGHSTNDPHALQLVASDAVPVGLAVLDAPDVDSVEEQNRLLAAQLLAAADLWIFVTSAARYADQVPWAFLRAAAERSTAVAVVLDRTPADAVQTVATHLARMLASRGLKDSPLFIVNEGTVSEDGLLPAGHVAEVRGWLDMLAADSGARQAVVRQTLEGAVRTVSRRAHPIADALVAQTGALAQLRHSADSAYDESLRALVAATADGTLLRGEVLARWQDFVGTGELLRSLESKVSKLRDRLVSAVKGKPQQAEQVQVALDSALELLVLEHAERAAGSAEAGWLQVQAGRTLVASAPGDLGRASRDLRRKAERAVRDWQQDVLDMVRSEGADKRSTARFLAFGVNGLSVALMVVVFAGADDESAEVGRTLLEAVFGEQAVRSLAERARTSLETRVRTLFADERSRYSDLLDGLGVDGAAAEGLRQAARRVDDARYAARLQGS